MPAFKWYHSLKFKLSLVLLLGLVALVSSTIGLSVSRNREFAQNDLSRWLQQFGDNIVADLSNQLAGKAALTVSLAAAAASLPREEDLYARLFPSLINFYGDPDISGGGIWPESRVFDPDVERRSFFWGRDADGKLQYDNTFNENEAGYHHEDWYVIGRHLAPGQAYWSKSYVYAQQPMVTCSVGVYDGDGVFTGVATVDVKLEGLQSFTEYWQKKTGGYVFITDQYNRLLSFPNPDLIQRRVTLADGSSSIEFLDANALAQKHPQFSPIAVSLDRMNQHLLQSAAKMPAYKAEVSAQLSAASNQFDAGLNQAELSAAIMMNPLVRSTYFKRFFIADDFITQQPSYVYTFYVPGTYWKLVIVKPAEELSAVTADLERSKLLYSALAAVPIFAITWFLLDWLIFVPLNASSRKLLEISALDVAQDWDGLKRCELRLPGRGEPALTAAVLKQLRKSLERQHQEIQTMRLSYENKISHQREREEMLTYHNNELEIQVEELLRAHKHSLPVSSNLPRAGNTMHSDGGSVLLPVREDCLLLSLDALPDNQGMALLLKQFQYQPLKHLILELSRLSPDTEASLLAAHVQALLLGGIRPILVGLPPNLATSLGQSGLLKFSQVQAHARLPDALRQVLNDPDRDESV